MLSGCSEFPNNHFFIQFSFFENIGNMLTDCWFTLIEQWYDLFLIKPYCIAFKTNIKFNTFFLLINDHFSHSIIGSVFPLITTIKAQMEKTLRLDILRLTFWTYQRLYIIHKTIINLSSAALIFGQRYIKNPELPSNSGVFCDNIVFSGRDAFSFTLLALRRERLYERE